MAKGEFQSTHPCGVRPAGLRHAQGCRAVSIHAPLRGATNADDTATATITLVSIHAPLRGATVGAVSRRFRQDVSIHAPLRGATLSAFGNFMSVPRFNPRTPAGCDAARGLQPACGQEVSIHAPLRGATDGTLYNHAGMPMFQSTHPCGVRPNGAFWRYPDGRFNPRTPAGCD